MTLSPDAVDAERTASDVEFAQRVLGASAAQNARAVQARAAAVRALCAIARSRASKV